MTRQCIDLEAYLEDALASSERERFEHHLVDCAACQSALDDVLQLLAAGSELSRRADRPRAAAIAKRPLLRRLTAGRWLAAGAAFAAAATVLLVLQLRQPAIEDQVFASLAPRRSFVQRLPYAPLDRYRAYDVDRGAQRTESIPITLAAEVARRRPPAALAAVLLATGDVRQVEASLTGTGSGAGAVAGRDDDLEIIRAAVAIERNRPGDALVHLDAVLARSPANGPALWNRAVALSQLQLPLTTAEAFDEGAKLGEPGWSSEAAWRAFDLRWDETARSTRWYAAKRACDQMVSGSVPDLSIVRASAPVCRLGFYEALRVAPSRERAQALRPVAHELDEAAGDRATTLLVDQVVAADPALRARAVAVYARLTGSRDLAPADRRRLLDELRASRQNDLVLGAIPRSGLPGLLDEYVARASASTDRYFHELAEERRADLRLAEGDPLGAELVLRRAVHDCSSREVELRCSNLQLALANVYETMHRPSDASAIAQAGLRRSRQLGLYWSEKLFFDFLAQAAWFEGANSLMRAYLHEATLRAPDCAQIRYEQETVAMASIEALAFDQARRALTLAPTCGESPTLERVRVTAELAPIDGTAAEAAELRAALVHTREQRGTTPSILANIDALEGRLLATSDPAAARPLLQRAIESADRIGRTDADAAKAHGDTYASLLVLSADEDDRATTLKLLAEAAGTPLRGPCAVGVMVDAERVLVVARDGAGAMLQHVAPRDRSRPELDAAELVPTAIVQALSACERIDVIALPPVFGLRNLLPPALAWSYRGRPVSPEAPPAKPPRIVTVADAVPPAELELAPLRAPALAPIPGATHVDLRGAEATPARVVAAFAHADAVEIHAHGFVDRGLSDASLIALSPQADGRFALGAREIAELRLTTAPVVVLAACHAAYTAPFRHEPWGLPRAFLLAGARAVIASPDTIPDAEAGEFFRAIERRIFEGTDPAIALRDERARRLQRDPDSWTRAVLLFD